jgi:hypothetical protein
MGRLLDDKQNGVFDICDDLAALDSSKVAGRSIDACMLESFSSISLSKYIWCGYLDSGF